ncbi:MAG TPA: hypothetical protein DDW27_14770 [Bacteroidales bacterium]|nr:hypothetical protein [Bacteroidales bacterium]
MEKFTIEEKETLLNAIDHYIGDRQRFRHVLTGDDKDKFVQETWKIQELRVKLILDIAPIEIKPSIDLWERPCILCGMADSPGVIEWAYVDNKPICQLCFKKHYPEAYEKARKLDEEYWMKEYPEDFNPDGTLKNVAPVGAVDLSF